MDNLIKLNKGGGVNLIEETVNYNFFLEGPHEASYTLIFSTLKSITAIKEFNILNSGGGGAAMIYIPDSSTVYNVFSITDNKVYLTLSTYTKADIAGEIIITAIGEPV